MSEQEIEQVFRRENSREKGENVEVMVKFIRHGERNKESNLTNYGRETTKKRAHESGLSKEQFDAVKPIGSDQGPKGPLGTGRSLETAQIFANEIAGDEAFTTRKKNALNFETIISERPYNHLAIYNSLLPDNFNNLSDVEKVAAAKKAQTGVVNHLMSLEGPNAEVYKKEVAGSHAYVVDHYMEVAKRLKSGSRVLLPTGTHGGNMELLLQQALVRQDEQGNTIVGFKNLSEIGGDFDPSEAYAVSIETDDKGEFKAIKVTFDNPNRPAAKQMYLDYEKVKELSEFYKKLHNVKI